MLVSPYRAQSCTMQRQNVNNAQKNNNLSFGNRQDFVDFMQKEFPKDPDANEAIDNITALKPKFLKDGEAVFDALLKPVRALVKKTNGAKMDEAIDQLTKGILDPDDDEDELMIINTLKDFIPKK